MYIPNKEGITSLQAVLVQLGQQRLQIIGHSLSRVLEPRRIGQRAGQRWVWNGYMAGMERVRGRVEGGAGEKGKRGRERGRQEAKARREREGAKEWP